ncbi:transposase [Haloechinothrix sp. LS1_15]|uniref:transposase n=1 Tax=Haloechinothrix sp. LS1_15 TaxID=2652248 RepID=UPI002946D12D|nr:transposase [Haloechinothrix sp. LS1_15]MDV6011623.1 transposase [Haloechinothrix sp. LS1_15]
MHGNSPTKPRPRPPVASVPVPRQPVAEPAGGLDELRASLFASLPRADQRKRAREYLDGLLATHGRKSIRNIAAAVSGRAAEQRLHHFICESTWDWTPVRRTLARYVAVTAPDHAWVVRPMRPPRNARWVLGVWSAWRRASVPVNWRLRPAGDHHRQGKGSLPRSTPQRPESVLEGVVGSCAELVRDWGLRPRPVVMDARGSDVPALVGGLAALGLPVLLRIGAGTLLHPACSASRAADRGMPAGELVGMARGRFASGSDGSEAAVATVRVPGQPGTHAGEAVSASLVAFGGTGTKVTAQLWLATHSDVAAGVLRRMSMLVQRVDDDRLHIADRVGIGDFTGGSLRGWHRHVTLASAAHAAMVFSRGTSET